MTTPTRLLSVAAVAGLVLLGCKNEGTTAVDAGAPVATITPPAPPAPPPPPPPLTDEERQQALYAFGVVIAQRTPVGSMGLTEAELDEVLKGVTDEATGKELAVKMEEFGPKVDQMLTARREAKAAAEKKKGDEFLARAAKEKGAKKLPSGLVYSDVTPGTGDSPKDTDTVSVHYRGTLTDGKEFDSSYKRGQPAEFPLKGVIKCWTEGVQKMKVGGKAKLICPPDIAYGDRGAPPDVPPHAVLVFEVELLSIKAAAAQPPMPANHP